MGLTEMGEQKSIDSIIRERHSTFPDQFDPDRKVDDQVIKDILELATWAPTHKMTEPWQFIVYDTEHIPDFFDKIKGVYCSGKSATEISPAKIKKYEKRKSQVSHVVIVNMIRDEQERIPEQEEVCAVSCAIQNIYLSLNNYDIAGYLSTGLIFNPHFNPAFNIADKDKCLGYFLLGVEKPDFNGPGRNRKPLSDKMVWI